MNTMAKLCPTRHGPARHGIHLDLSRLNKFRQKNNLSLCIEQIIIICANADDFDGQHLLSTF